MESWYELLIGKMKEKAVQKSNTDAKTKSFHIYKFLTFFLAAALVVVLGIVLRNWYVEKRAGRQFDALAAQVNRPVSPSGGFSPETGLGTEALMGTDETESGEPDIEMSGVEIPPKNLDWDAIREVNGDIYAWIYIPGTQVDYPILQHPTDDSYYLNYNMNGSRGYPGCIYSERVNRRAFTDFDTILYGHNMRNASMFATLHYFEEQAFFNNSRYIYVYTEDKVLVYEVFAAYAGDDRHIMYAYDFSAEEGRLAYLDDIWTTAQAAGRTRDLQVGADSHILTLSTCVRGQSGSRYLVQAKLLNEEALAAADYE